jgi:hypothetical protein
MPTASPTAPRGRPVHCKQTQMTHTDGECDEQAAVNAETGAKQRRTHGLLQRPLLRVQVASQRRACALPHAADTPPRERPSRSRNSKRAIEQRNGKNYELQTDAMYLKLSVLFLQFSVLFLQLAEVRLKRNIPQPIGLSK